MLSDDRSEISFKRNTHAIAAMDADEAATVEVNLGVSTGLVNPIHLEAGRT
jgi:hypothetical protein